MSISTRLAVRENKLSWIGLGTLRSTALMNRATRISLVLVACLGLTAGCGGDGSDSPPPNGTPEFHH